MPFDFKFAADVSARWRLAGNPEMVAVDSLTGERFAVDDSAYGCDDRTIAGGQAALECSQPSGDGVGHIGQSLDGGHQHQHGRHAVHQRQQQVVVVDRGHAGHFRPIIEAPAQPEFGGGNFAVGCQQFPAVGR